MKTSFLIVIIAILSTYAVAYIEGRINTVLIIPPFLPATLILVLISIFGFIYFVIHWIKSIVKKQKVLSGFLMLLLLVISVLIVKSFPTMIMRKIGFKIYASSTLTEDEWKNIRMKSKEIIGVKNRLPILRLCKHRNDTNLQKWNKMLSVTKISKLGDWAQISVRDSSTTVYWGGAITGHWGISIYDNLQKGRENSTTVNGFMTVYISPD